MNDMLVKNQCTDINVRVDHSEVVLNTRFPLDLTRRYRGWVPRSGLLLSQLLDFGSSSLVFFVRTSQHCPGVSIWKDQFSSGEEHC